MKEFFASLLGSFLLLILATSVIAQDGVDAKPDQEKAKAFKAKLKAELEDALKSSESLDSLALFRACGAGLASQSYEDAGFLFYSAQIRASLDHKIYPPTAAGGDNPMVAVAAVNSELGSVVNPVMLRQPKVYAKVKKRLQKWNPDYGDQYNPGWKFKEKLPVEKQKDLLKDARQSYLEAMETYEKLLQHEEYFKIFKQRQDTRLPLKIIQAVEGLDYKPAKLSQKELDEGVKRGAEIEKELGILNGPLLRIQRSREQRKTESNPPIKK